MEGEVATDGKIWSTLRQRLRCEIIREGSRFKGSEEGGDAKKLVLNDLWIGSTGGSVMSRLDIYAQQEKIGQFQADGLILATPTGASAYSLAAGGSIVSPTVPCILLTPVASHSLSNRPIVLPTSLSLEIRVPARNRAQILASFDGSDPVPLDTGDAIRVCVLLLFSILTNVLTFFTFSKITNLN